MFVNGDRCATQQHAIFTADNPADKSKVKEPGEEAVNPTVLISRTARRKHDLPRREVWK
jgi:hypothetical protein